MEQTLLMATTLGMRRLASHVMAPRMLLHVACLAVLPLLGLGATASGNGQCKQPVRVKFA